MHYTKLYYRNENMAVFNSCSLYIAGYITNNNVITYYNAT